VAGLLIFLGFPLSSSRPPRLGRPYGPSHAIGYAAPRPGDHLQGSGAYQEDGEECSASARVVWPPVFSLVHCRSPE
jgi:hypothetical protein